MYYIAANATPMTETPQMPSTTGYGQRTTTGKYISKGSKGVGLFCP